MLDAAKQQQIIQRGQGQLADVIGGLISKLQNKQLSFVVCYLLWPNRQNPFTMIEMRPKRGYFDRNDFI